MIKNYYIVYAFVKALVTPFKDWDAAKQGVIDATGNVITPKAKRSKAQEQSFTRFDVLCRNVKRILEKVPGGASRLASFSAALYLIREHNAFSDGGNTLVEDADYGYAIDVDKLGDFVTETVTAAVVQSDGWMSKAAQKKRIKGNDGSSIFAGIR